MSTTPNQLSLLNIQDSYVANSLSMDDKMQAVYDLSEGYNTLTYLVDKLSNAKSRQVVGQDGKFQKALFGRANVIIPIASNTAVGANIKVFFTDPTYSLFRVNEIVLDSNRNQGRVVTSAPGYVILSPTAATPTFNTTTMFIATMWVKSGWNASINFGSTNPQPLNQVPFYDYNYTSISRATGSYFRRNQNDTWVRFNGKYWYTSIDKFMMEDYAKQIERKAWMGSRGLVTGADGVRSESGGLIWAIKDPIRGGIVQPMSNNPTKADFETFAKSIARRQANPTSSQIWLVGQDALANIQTNYTQNFIQFSGQNNTFGGGEVKGLDVRMLAIAGATVKLVPCRFFDDMEYFPETSLIPGVSGTKMGNTIVALDDGMINSVGAGMLPSIERCYFGNAEMEYGCQLGIGMQSTGMNLKQGGNPFQLISSDTDSITFSVYSDMCYDAICTRMGIMELTS